MVLSDDYNAEFLAPNREFFAGVEIWDMNNHSEACTGAFVDERNILTSTKCFYNENGVRLGRLLVSVLF